VAGHEAVQRIGIHGLVDHHLVIPHVTGEPVVEKVVVEQFLKSAV
jgi:hypothetical protein